MHQSTKIIDGFSATFRQWRAKHSHCQFLHGYALKFKIIFEAENLDDCNWVMDFGFSKRVLVNEKQSLKDWFTMMFDHTTLVASDDPHLFFFNEMAKEKLIQLQIVPKVGCEAFAELVWSQLQTVITKETGGRVRVKSVECIEHSKNSAIYSI